MATTISGLTTLDLTTIALTTTKDPMSSEVSWVMVLFWDLPWGPKTMETSLKVNWEILVLMAGRWEFFSGILNVIKLTIGVHYSMFLQDSFILFLDFLSLIAKRTSSGSILLLLLGIKFADMSVNIATYLFVLNLNPWTISVSSYLPKNSSKS